MALGKQIKIHRTRLGLTLEQLSDASGVEIGTISALENRDSSRSKYATALAAAMGMTVEQLEGLPPSSYTQTASNQAQSEKNNNSEGAMLVDFNRAREARSSAQDHHFIPQYRAGGSMGNGITLPDQPGVIQNWSVSREWLQKNVRNVTGVQNLCIVTGFGPSMQPMYNPGDPLLVDTGVSSVIADGIYFFRVGAEGFIKQLQKIPTASGIKYVAKSKNPDYDNFDITPDMDFEVLGRVVRVWCGTDF